MQTELMIIQCDTATDKQAEIPVRRTLINMGLIKQAEKIVDGSVISYWVHVTPAQAAEIKKAHP